MILQPTDNVRENKRREKAFLAEYQDYGIEFLMHKYGKPRDIVLAELRRIAPSRIFKEDTPNEKSN